MLPLLWVFVANAIGLVGAPPVAPENEEILMDSIQINPGNPYGYQPSKYSDMRYLKTLGYTARSSSMEQSPALCIDFKAADGVPDGGIFSTDRNMLAWTRMYCQGIDGMMQETVSEGLEMHFFTDMIVFPTPLLKLYPQALRENTTSTILWNNYTEYLLEVMLDEWFERFPLTSGIVIRTGETYTFDTPYHTGSSPVAGVANMVEQRDVWIGFVNLLRTVVCVKHGRKVVFRTWDSLVDVDSYLEATDPVIPHPLLYFAVKHTAGDFFRQMAFNDLLGRGRHAQIVEVQIQREYEGKGAYPLYIFEHVVLGDESSGTNQSLSRLFPTGRNESSLIKGLWTWSRGGGWWGPYIHGAEFWIDLNLHLFVEWWRSNCTTTESNIADVFVDVCQKMLSKPQSWLHSDSITVVASAATFMDGLPSPRDACLSLHEASLLADRAMLLGRYCMESEQPIYSACWIWTRDDRMGGFGALSSHMKYLQGNETRMALSLSYKTESIALWKRAFSIYDAQVGPLFSAAQPRLGRQIQSSFLYAQCYFCIVESAWRAMIHGVLGNKSTQTRSLTHLAIADYDECWVEYRALALSLPEFPSLYKGTSWNFPFQSEPDGMDASINKLRRIISTDETDRASQSILISSFK